MRYSLLTSALLVCAFSLIAQSGPPSFNPSARLTGSTPREQPDAPSDLLRDDTLGVLSPSQSAKDAHFPLTTIEVPGFVCGASFPDDGADYSSLTPIIFYQLRAPGNQLIVGKNDAQGKIVISCRIGPVTTITGNPPLLTNQTSASFTFTADRPATFECSLDGGAFTLCASPFDIPGPLAESGHTLSVHGIDTLGNYGDDAIYNWTIDTTRPDTTLTMTQPNPTNDPTGHFAFTATEPGGTFECRVDGGAFVSCISPYSTATLADGSHTFAVRAIDAAGNVDATPAGYNWVVDTAAPAITITSPTSAPTFTTAASAVALAGTASDNVSIATVSWINAANGANGSATGTTAWSVASVPLLSGTNVITVTSTDTAGNTATDTITVTRDNTAPTVTITNPTSAAKFTAAASTVALGGTASDPSGIATVTWSNLTNSTSGAATGTTSWSVASVTLVAGNNILNVTATDGVGNTASAAITVFTCTAQTYPAGAGFAAANGHCYVKFNTLVTRANALANCQALNGGAANTLVTITDATENSLVTTLATTARWLDLNDIVTEGTFVWSTAEPFSYSNWLGGSPASAGNTATNDCTSIATTGQWSVVACGNSLAYICERIP